MKSNSGHVQTKTTKRSKPESKKVEGALQEKAELNIQILGRSPFCIIIAMSDGMVVASSRTMQNMIGYSAVELSEINISDIYEKKEDCKVLFETIKRNGYAVDIPVRLKRKNGKPYDALLNALKIKLGDKEYIQIIYQNISQSKPEEKSVIQEHELMKSLMDNTTDSIYFKDLKSRFIMVSRNMAVKHGVQDPQEAIGKTDFDFFDKVSAKEFQKNEQNIIRTGKPQIDIEVEEKWADGHSNWASKTTMPLRNQAGDIIGVFGISRDITKRKAAEEESRQISRFPDENPNPLFRFTPDGKILYANKSGYPILKKWNTAVGGLVPENWKKMICLFFKNGTSVEREIECDNRIYSFIFAPILKEKYINAYGRDATKRMAAEKSLRILVEQEKEDRKFAEALASNAMAINSTLETDDVLTNLIYNIGKVVQSDAISIMLIQGNYAKIISAKGYQERGLTDWYNQKHFDLNEIKTLREVIRSKKYKITANTDISKDWVPIAETAWIKSNIISPILDDKTVIGFVNIDSTTPDFYTEEHARLLMAFTEQVSTALKNARTYEGTRRRMNRMHAMTQIDKAINSSLDLDISLEIVLVRTKEQLHADAVNILLANDVTNSLNYFKSTGFKTDGIRKSNLGLGNGLSGKAVLERTTIAIPDLNSAPESYFKNMLIDREGFISYYCVPLIAKGKIKGVIEVYFRHAFQAEQEWLEFLEILAQQTAIAINNAELLNSLEVSNIELLNAYESTLKGWVDALDMRDKETQGHTQRVTDISLKLASRMGIKDNEIVHFERGAILHDIGKVAIPDTILNKPGPLTDEEWVIMRSHPQIAFQLLSKSKYLIPALDIPYCHHEKWDGSGYPRGLKGNAIPLAARIFAIVDVWDALTSDRPYRKAWTNKKVMLYIQEQKGKHFDPEIVTAFQAMIKED